MRPSLIAAGRPLPRKFNEPENLNSSHRVHREHRGNQRYPAVSVHTRKVDQFPVPTVWFSSVISVFSVANRVFKDESRELRTPKDSPGIRENKLSALYPCPL